MGPAAVVLAAGESLRFGAPKQLAPLWGRPLLEHAVAAACASPVQDVVVVLGARAGEVAAGVALGRARVVVCEDWAEGQGASLRTGVEAVADAPCAVLMLGDQPLISPEAVARVLEARDGESLGLRATYGGRPSHPVVVERALYGALLEVRGDIGAREVLRAAATGLVPCDGLGAPDDVDTPDALGALAVSGRA